MEEYELIDILSSKNNKRVYLIRKNKQFYIEKILPEDLYSLYVSLKFLSTYINIPTIYSINRESNEIHVLEEYINYPTLDKYEHNFTETQIDEIMKQLFMTLSKLHKENIIHRDIKPENIFYDGKNIYLNDFDISRFTTHQKSHDTTILGTVGYAPPEQFGFNETDVTSDIYSLGVLLNYLYTKDLPYRNRHKGRNNKVILKATQIDPTMRYTSIDKMAKDYQYTHVKDQLPGFRSYKISHMIISIIGYISIIFFSVTLEIDNPKNQFDIYLNRFIFF